jgi:hypothetical protein
MANEIKRKRRSIISQIIRGILYFLGGAVSLLAIFIFIIPGILSVFWGKDIPPVDDSTLQLQIINLPKEENSFYDLEKISTSINSENFPKDEKYLIGYLKSDSWEQNSVEMLLNDNQQALQYFSEAAAKGKFQSPNTDNPDKISADSPVVAMASWREISRLSGVKAIWLAKNGKSGEAINEAFNSIIVGNAMERSQCDLVTYLVGVAMETNGLDVLQKVMSVIPKDYPDLQKYKMKLENYTSISNPSPFEGEYLVSKKSWQEVISSKDVNAGLKYVLKNRFYFKLNLTVKYSFDFFNEIIAESQKDCSEVKEVKKFEELNREPDNPFKAYFTENLWGKVYTGIAALAFNNVIEKRCQLEKKFQDTLLMLNN